MNYVRRILSAMLLLILTTVLTGTALSAELGSGKTLKADKGPTLEETLGFIKDKIKEFHVEQSHSSFVQPNYYSEDDYSYDDISIVSEGCAVTVTMDKQTENHESNIGHAYWHNIFIFRLNLKNINSVITGIIPRFSGHIDTYNGTPVIKVILKGKDISLQSRRFDVTKFNEPYNIDSMIFEIKNRDYANRLVNAFEHAVQLCGGGQSIGKEELF
jgi:hypothetical protein